MKRITLLISIIILLFLLFPGIVAAAPHLPGATAVGGLMAEGESVNLPGWVGGTLAIIALVLPLAFQMWVRQSK